MSTPGEPAALDQSLASGIAWTASLRWTSQVISWVGTVYAARLLVPADYGLVSMAMLAIGLARMVEDFGLDAILVQDRSIAEASQARLAGLIVLLALGLCLAFALAAQPIAEFFGEPAVRNVVLVMSLVFITDALQVVPRAQLQRRLQFRQLAIVQFVQVLATQAVLVSAATLGLGYWSLVVSHLSGALAVTLLLMWWSPYRIRWPADMARLAQPLLQGWRILASRAAWYGYSNADQTIIGRVLGKEALGAYSFALTFSSLAQQEIGSIVSRVVPGIFSQVQLQRDQLRRYFLLLTELLVTITFPMAIGLALVADLFVPLVLGPQWDAVIAPLRLLCLYSAFLSSQTLLSHILMWTGQFRANMWCTIVACVAMPLAFLVGVRSGLEGIGWAWVLVAPLANIPAFVIAFRTIDIGFREWFAALTPAVAGCIVMVMVVLGVRAAMPDTLPLAVRCAGAIVAGAAAYPAVVWFGYRSRVNHLLDLARSIRHGSGVVAGAAPPA